MRERREGEKMEEGKRRREGGMEEGEKKEEGRRRRGKREGTMYLKVC